MSLAQNELRSVTFLPNGHVYDLNTWVIDDLAERCPHELSRFLTLDSVKRSETIDSPIGKLQFIWSGSHLFGVSTFLRDGVTVNSAVFLPGNDRTEETKLLQYYLNSWRNFPIVKELCGDSVPFKMAEETEDRPLMVSVNWSTIKKEDYDQIAYYDLFVGAKYFQSAM
jgi:hypothetical protein